MDETDRSAPPKLSAQRQSLLDTAEYVKFLEKEFERTCDGGERIATSDSSYEEQVVEGFKERIG